MRAFEGDPFVFCSTSSLCIASALFVFILQSCPYTWLNSGSEDPCLYLAVTVDLIVLHFFFDPSSSDESMTVFFTKKTSSCVEVRTCRFVQIWKFCYEQGSLALKSLQSKSEQKLVHSHIIGFSGSGLGLVKIFLGKYIPDWEAGNSWSPSSLSPLEHWIHHHFLAS